MKEKGLKELKENYALFQKKYTLPSFEKLNEDFQIEKIDFETDFIIREIRKIISDKLVNYLKIVETLLHPTNVPFFVYSMVKVIGKNEKDNLNEFYKRLSMIQIELIKLDLIYNEKSEADFVKRAFNEWDSMKKQLHDLISFIEKNIDKKTDNERRGYFG